MGVVGAEGAGGGFWGDCGGVTAGKGSNVSPLEGLSEALPTSASFPFTPYRGSPGKEDNDKACNKKQMMGVNRKKKMQQNMNKIQLIPLNDNELDNTK